MKLHLAISCLAASSLFLSGDSHELRVKYAAGDEIRHEYSHSLELTTGEMTVFVNGQELPAEIIEQFSGEMGIDETAHDQIVTVSEVMKTEDGAPVQIRRSWELIEEGSDSEDEEPRTSPLEGRTLMLTLEEGEVLGQVDDKGEEVDESLLENHDLNYDYEVLLPEGKREVGDSWELDESAAEALLSMTGGGSLYVEEEEEEKDAFDELIEQAAAQSITITFEEVREVGGVRCAVLTYEALLEGELDDASEFFADDEEEREEIDAAMSFRFTVEAELLFDMESGKAIESTQDIAGGFSMKMEMTEETEQMDLDFEINMEVQLTGQILNVWSFENQGEE